MSRLNKKKYVIEYNYIIVTIVEKLKIFNGINVNALIK